MFNCKAIGHYKLSVAIVSFAFITTFSNAQTKDARAVLIHQIDSILTSQVDDSKIPGAVIEIKKDGKVVYKQAYGYAQKFNDAHEPLAVPERMTTEHLFDIASLTKVVGTTTSIMLLVDRGLIRVDDPVSKYIKAFGDSAKAPITIRHLLTHTAGLYGWYPLYYRAHNKQETFKLIGELPLAFPVGAQRVYSDLGFTVLGEIIEKVSGLPLDQFEEQNIFIPLGMGHTMFNPLKKHQHYKIAATGPGNPFEHRMVYDPSMGYQFKEVKPDQWNGWRRYVLRGEVDDGNAWYAEQRSVAGAAGLTGAAGLSSAAGFKGGVGLTGAACFDYVAGLAKRYGWEFGGEIAGHIVGRFPHEQPEAGGWGLDLHPDNHDDILQPDKHGNSRHWILEIQFVDRANKIGAFFEQLLY